jgi:hypothetical protein
MRQHGKLASAALACIVLSSCASSLRRTGYTPATEPAGVDCRVAFKQAFQANADEADVLGTVSASDTGFSIKCDEGYVLSRLRDDACAIGADVVSLTDERAPDFWSTCYRAKATLLRLRDRTAAETVTSDARYDHGPLTERSLVTYRRTQAAIAGGMMGGMVGGAVAP